MIALDKIEKVGIEQVISDVKTLVSANFDEAKLRAFLGLSVGACLAEVLLLVSIHMPGVLSLLPAARVLSQDGEREAR